MSHLSFSDTNKLPHLPQPTTYRGGLLDWIDRERAEGITAPRSGRELVAERLAAYDDGQLQRTQPIPVIRYIATTQPQPVRRAPWWRRVLFTWLASGALGLVVALGWAWCYAHAGGR